MLGWCLVSFHFLWAILCPQAVNQRGISGTAIFYTVEKAAAHSCLSLCLPRSVFVADGLCPSFPATGG